MKKILIILLSLVMCMGLMTAIFGCGQVEMPVAPGGNNNGDDEIPEDPDLGDDQIKNFTNAWEAFTYARNHFENEATDYTTYMWGTSVNGGVLGMGKGTQTIYNERYKSSTTNNFYFNTNCHGDDINAVITTIDPCMALKVYKENNSNSFQAHIEYGRFEKNKYGPRWIDNKIVADFNGINYGNSLNSDSMISTFGSDPTKLSVYIIDENTIKDRYPSSFKQSDGSYKFTYDFKEGVHKNYGIQVKSFTNGQSYGGWKSTSITFTIDKFGRIKKFECQDVYTVAGAEVKAATAEDFFYGRSPRIAFSNGGITAERGDPISVDNSVNITFMHGNKILDTRKTVYGDGEALGEFPIVSDAPSEENYELIGWFDKPNGAGKKYTPETVLEEKKDLTLYVYYRYNKYKISFFNDDGNLCDSIEGFQTGNRIIIPSSANDEKAKDPNYDFMGWFTKQNGEGVQYKNRDVYSEYADLNLYAYYKYNKHKVTFHYNDGSEDSVQNFKVGDKLVLPSLTDPNYDYFGWFTNANGEGTKYEAGTTLSEYADLELYVYSKYNRFTVTFHYDDGSEDSVQNFKVGDKLVLPSLTDPNYDYFGWFTNANGEGTKYEAGTTLSEYADLELYAYRKLNRYIVIFYNDNGSINSAKDFKVGDILILPEMTDGNYDLVGWFTLPNGEGVKYEQGTILSKYSNLELHGYRKYNRFTVIFRYEDESISTQDFKVGEALILPELTDDNYDLVGWFTLPNGEGVKYEQGTILSEYANLELYVYSKYNRFTVTFRCDDGSLISTQAFKVGEALVLPELTDDNYDVVGWFTLQNGEGTKYEAGTILSEYANLELYVYSKYNRFTVTFRCDDGSLISTQAFKVGDKLVLPELTDGNYDYLGWFTLPNGEGVKYEAGTILSEYADLELYVYRKYNKFVAIFYNDSGSINRAYDFKVGDELVLPEMTDENYDYLGWFTLPNGEGTKYEAGTILSEYANLELYVYRKYNKFVAIFYNDSGSINRAYDFKVGDELVLPEMTDENYDYFGWFTLPNGEGTKYEAGTILSEYANLELYVYCKYNKYTVTFYNGDGSVNSTQDFKVGDELVLPELTDDNYDYFGWFTLPNGEGTKYVSGAILSEYANLELYVYSKLNGYTVIFYNSDGSVNGTREFKVGDELVLPELTDENYDYFGWFTLPNGQGTKYVSGAILSEYADLGLYVYCKYNKYTVTFYNSDGSVNSTQEFKVGEALVLPEMTDENYDYFGWFTLPNGQSTKYEAGTILSEYADLELYVYCKYNKYTVTFYNSDDIIGTQEFKVGDELVLPEMTDDNYDYLGWFTEANGKGTKYEAGTILSEYADLSLYIYSKLNGYTVTFYNSDGSVNSTQEFKVGDRLALPLDNPDYDYVGWFTEANGQGTKYVNGAILSEYANLKLYVFCKYNKYTVTFYNAQGAVIGTQAFKVGDRLSLPSDTGSEKDKNTNYDLFWLTKLNGEGIRYQNNVVLSEYGNLSLYAYHKYNRYIVTFYNENGSINKEAVFKVGDRVSVHVSNPSKSGWTFQGWYTQTGGQGTRYQNTSTLSNYDDMYLYAYFTENSCVAAGTLITLADGRQVPVESLTGNELLLVWNHKEGKFDFAPIIMMHVDVLQEHRVTRLYFSDGTDIKIIGEHAFWDFDLNRYVYMRSDAANYIGHWFNKHVVDDNGNFTWIRVQLVNVVLETEYTTAWSPVTFKHLSLYVNGFLSMPGLTEPLVNIFEVDAETLQYVEEAFLADIEEYGLYTYDEFADLLTKEVFDAFGVQYFKIAIGKGLLDWETIYGLISLFEELTNG